MKKVILTASILLSAFVASYAQKAPATTTTPANPNAPEMIFDKELHDFGTIKQGGDGTIEFKFKNTGKEPLVISNAQGSCGCTVPKWPKEPIAPGKSDVIKVTYDTKRVGGFNKTVTLTSNAKTQTKVLTIKGNVEGVPAEVPFGMENKSGAPFENNK